MPLKTSFEKEVCGRCGGSGHYSYNQLDGSRCYGCNGKGERLTKRGRAAAMFLRERLQKPAREVQVGDRMEVMGVVGNGAVYTRYSKVVGVVFHEESNGSTMVNGEWVKNPPDMSIETEHSSLRCGRDHVVKVKPPAEEHAALIAEAVEYQSKLTKAGKLMKRFADAS